MGSGSGVYFAATPSGPLGRFEITDSYFYRNQGSGIVIESGAQNPPAATATSLISTNIIGYDPPASLFTSGNGTNSAGIRLGNGASKIDILSNAIYTANKPAIDVTSAAGSAIRLGVNASQSPNVFQSANAYSTEGSPFDLLADALPLDNDPGDSDSGPNGLQNKPTILTGGISFANGVWTVPLQLEAGTYDLTAYRFDSVAQKWSFFQQQGNTTFSSSTVPNSIGLFTSNGWLAGQRFAIVATNKSTNVNSSSEFSQAETLTAALVGDYNRDGRVDGGDYIVWRKSFGWSVTPYSGADGNGDGTITVTDFAIWKGNFGAPGPGSAATVPGDYNADGIVDDADFDLWESTFGSTTNLAADGNYNGIVDMADLQVWQEMRGVTMQETLIGDFNSDHIVDTADHALWVAGDAAADADGDSVVLGDMDDFDIWEAHFGNVRADVFPLVANGTDGMPLEIPDAAPVVLGVTVGGFDFASVDGSGEQLRSITATNPNSVSIRFSEEVYVTLGALQVINLDGSSPASVTSFGYDLATQTATWTFNAPFADGRTLIRLSDSVFDLDHEALDGEFTNPWTLSDVGTSVFPTGDGEAGGEFRFRFTVLAGDTDHNNIDGAANYQNWKSYEPGMIHVSTTADEFDADLSFGDVSLREAVNHANTASESTVIDLPAGRYYLTRVGTESSTNTDFNDLTILGNVSIVGAGAGATIIDPQFGPVQGAIYRAFKVAGSSARLDISNVTLTGAFIWQSPAVQNSGGIFVTDQATLRLSESAIVNNQIVSGYATGVAIRSIGGNVTIERSVFTNNYSWNGAAVDAAPQGAVNGSLTIGESIFALNTAASSTPNVKVTGAVTKNNLDMNLYDNAAGGFFDTVSGAGDHQGTPQYVVTTILDTFDHSNDIESTSVREAVDLANTTAGEQEIWIPAWNFVLTRDRGSLTSDVDTAFGDLDVKQSLVVRGVTDRTSITWKAGVADDVFDLLGDYNIVGAPDANTVSSGDYVTWQSQSGSTGTYEQFVADGDDDGDVDQDDYYIWSQHYGNTLQLFDIGV